MRYWRIIDARTCALLSIVTATNRIEAYRIGKTLFGETPIRVADSDTPNFGMLLVHPEKSSVFPD